MNKPADASLAAFQWAPQPQAEKFILGVVDDFLARCPDAFKLRDHMRERAGTRFVDWIDSIHLPANGELRQSMAAVGYVKEIDPAQDHGSIFFHPEGLFPRIVLHDLPTTAIWIKAESVADFAAVWGIASAHIEGEPLSPLRRLKAYAGDGAELWVVERHGHRGFDQPQSNPQREILTETAYESFRTRRRHHNDEAAGFDQTRALIDAAIQNLGVDLACDRFFAAEREYWQRRNRAAQAQKGRQDRLGLGWANHDHHTYRSSREHFTRLISIFETLGFTCRERFYAGREAGWGAQVLEQARAGIVIFADVDLSPEELKNDFAHEPLAPRESLGTVGLWCALHGESFLQAGMHHLECQFDFEALKKQLETEQGIHVMKPFTDFPYLRQAFTEGERWRVDDRRIDRLVAGGFITAEQAVQFREQGAIGSHLENLERNEGFKGFNQHGVSEIISITDPRRHLTNA